MRKINILFGALALAGVASGAQAATLTDTVKPNIGLQLTYGGNTLKVGAGPFDATVSGIAGLSPATHFDAYCVDLSHYLQSTQTVTPVSARQYLQNGAQVAYLYNTFASTVGTDKVKGAALQLSIWETVYDYDPGSKSLGKGLNTGLLIYGGTLDASLNDAVVAQAKADLTSLLRNGTNYAGDVTYFSATHDGSLSQSLIGPAAIDKYTVTPVPEPGAVSLAAAGLVGTAVFGLRRKRKAKA